MIYFVSDFCYIANYWNSDRINKAKANSLTLVVEGLKFWLAVYMLSILNKYCSRTSKSHKIHYPLSIQPKFNTKGPQMLIYQFYQQFYLKNPILIDKELPRRFFFETFRTQ